MAIGEIKGSDELAKRLEEKNIRVIRLKYLIREINLWRDIAAAFEIRGLLKKEKPDVVHLNSTKAGFIGALAGWLSTPPRLPFVRRGDWQPRLIYTIHGWIFNEPLPIWRKKLYLHLEKISAQICDALIVLSQNDEQIGVDKKICASQKLKLIPHGIVPPEFLSPNEARKKICNLQSAICIGSVANFYPTKGLPYLIEAAKILKNENINFQLVIIGDGKERKNLETLIKRGDLENIIILIGQIPDAAKYLRAFDIFALPSLKEGLPYAILEAMYAALPIVATRVGGIPEMITEGVSGLLVPPKNPEALAKTLKKLIEDLELRERLGQKANEAAEQRFNLKRMLEETKKIYAN